MDGSKPKFKTLMNMNGDSAPSKEEMKVCLECLREKFFNLSYITQLQGFNFYEQLKEEVDYKNYKKLF